jgi:phospholipase/carboxylesterase
MPPDMTLQSYHFIERPAHAGAPLFFTFHGTGGDEYQFFELATQLLPDAHVISIRGDVSEYGALRFFKRKAEGVYDLDDLAMRTTALSQFVAAHVERVTPSRVVGLGYSNGANILASIAFKVPQLFDTMVLMHPLIPWTPEDTSHLSGKRILITAGKHDPICPVPQTEQLFSFFKRQAADVSLQWHDGGHELRPTEVEFARRILM